MNWYINILVILFVLPQVLNVNSWLFWVGTILYFALYILLKLTMLGFRKNREMKNLENKEAASKLKIIDLDDVKNYKVAGGVTEVKSQQEIAYITNITNKLKK